MARSASQLSEAKDREASNKGLAAPKNMTQKYGANAQHVYSAQNLKSSMTGGVPAPNLKDPFGYKQQLQQQYQIPNLQKASEKAMSGYNDFQAGVTKNLHNISDTSKNPVALPVQGLQASNYANQQNEVGTALNNELAQINQRLGYAQQGYGQDMSFYTGEQQQATQASEFQQQQADQNKPQLITGKDLMGNTTYSLYNPATGTITPAQTDSNGNVSFGQGGAQVAGATQPQAMPQPTAMAQNGAGAAYGTTTPNMNVNGAGVTEGGTIQNQPIQGAQSQQTAQTTPAQQTNQNVAQLFPALPAANQASMSSAIQEAQANKVTLNMPLLQHLAQQYPSQATQIAAVAAYQNKPLPETASGTGPNDDFMNAVRQVNPNFDPSGYDTNETFGNITHATATGKTYISQDDLKDYSPADKVSIMNKADAQGIPILNTADAKQMEGIDIARANIQNMQSIIPKVNPSNWFARLLPFIPGVKSVIGNELRAVFQTDPDITSFDQAKQGIVAANAAILSSGSTRGVSPRMIGYLNDLVPSINDTEDDAGAKLQELTTQLTSAEDTLLNAPIQTSSASADWLPGKTTSGMSYTISY